MAVESSGYSKGNPRTYELVENAPKTGKSTVWAWPQLIEYLKVAAQPVQGPWPPHQQPRTDPEAEPMPVAVPDPTAFPRTKPETTAHTGETAAPSLPEFAQAPAREPAAWAEGAPAAPAPEAPSESDRREN